MQPHTRKLETISYVASQQKAINLPRNNVYRGIWLCLKATLTNGSTAPVGLASDAEHALVTRVEIVANGRDTIKTAPMSAFKIMNRYDQGADHKAGSTVNLTADAVATIEAWAYIPFRLMRGVAPMDAALDSRHLESLDLRVTFGSESSIFFTTVNAAALTNVTLEVSTQEYLGVAPNKKFFLNKTHKIEKEVTATRSDFPIDLVTDTVYRRFFIVTISDGLRVDTILNNYKLKSGTFVYDDIPDDHIQARNKVDYNLEQITTGVYVLERITDGRITESLDSRGFSSLEMVLDVTSVGTTDIVYVYPEIIEGI